MTKPLASSLLIAVAVVGIAAPARTQERGGALIRSLPRGTERARDLGMLEEISTRRGEVMIDVTALADDRVIGREVVLDLFPDLAITARLERRLDDGFGPVWRGVVNGAAAGSLTLVGDGERISGSIVSRAGRYEILATGRGRAVVLEIDSSAQLPDIALAPESRGRGRRHKAAGRAAKSVIDVLVLFTTEAKKQQPPIPGGLKGLIRLGIANMNTAMENSQIDIEVRLVKLKKVKYGKSGNDLDFMSDALVDLTGDDDGDMDAVHKWRDRFGADFVALIVERNNGACGLGWIGGERAGLEDVDGDWAFSVTAWRCLSFETLAHELGHNMGAQHSRVDPVSDRAGAYDFAFGHKVEQKLKTIMAYNCETGCTGFLGYSNPDVSMNGTPTGVAAGAADSADNHRAFNNDRHVMASYRACAVKCE